MATPADAENAKPADANRGRGNLVFTWRSWPI